MTRHHTGGVYTNGPGPKPWVTKNIGRSWGVIWQEDQSQLEPIKDHRGRVLSHYRRMVPVRTRSRYMPHIGAKQRSKHV